MKFSTRLRMLRKERKLNQDAFETIGIGRKTISNYENEVSHPDIDTLRNIADFLGVTTDYLLGNTDNPKMNVIDVVEISNDELLDAYYAEKIKMEFAKKVEDLDTNDVEKIFEYIDFLKARKQTTKEAAKSEK